MRSSCLLINLFPGRHYDSQSRETSSLKLFSWRLVLRQEIVRMPIKSFNTIFENTIKSLQIYLGQADIDKISLWIVTSAIISDCNWTRTHNHLVHKRTLNHLAKLAKWLSCVVSTYLYGAFDCMFLSCHVRVLEWIHTL